MFFIGFAAGEDAPGPAFFAIMDENEYDENNTGMVVPSYLNGSGWTAQIPNNDIISAPELPHEFSWRRKGIMTPVKNQSNCGSCYAFNSVGMIEAYFKKDSGITYDLSEEQAKNCMWESINTCKTCLGGCWGGTVEWVINIFTQNGIILENDFPYKPVWGACKTDIAPVIRITDWHMISTDEVPDDDLLKYHIMNDGPLSVSLYVDKWNRSYDGSYVIQDTNNTMRKHGVVLVGWNDSLENKSIPGHWYFKNSWGERWGDQGYGKIKYGKDEIGTHASIITGYEPYNPNVRTLYYDEAGMTGGVGILGENCIKGLCIYHTGCENVVNIEFWTTGKTSDIDLYLYDDFNHSSTSGINSTFGNLLYSIEDLSYQHPGYHSIKIDKPVSSNTGKVVVMAKITNIDTIFNNIYPAPIAFGHKGMIKTKTTYVSVGDPNSKHYNNLWYDLSKLKMEKPHIPKDVALRLRVTPNVDEPKCNYILLDTVGSIHEIEVNESIELVPICYDKDYNELDINDLTYISWDIQNESVGTITDLNFTATMVGNTTITMLGGPCTHTYSNSMIIEVIPDSIENIEPTPTPTTKRSGGGGQSYSKTPPHIIPAPTPEQTTAHLEPVFESVIQEPEILYNTTSHNTTVPEQQKSRTISGIIIIFALAGIISLGWILNKK